MVNTTYSWGIIPWQYNGLEKLAGKTIPGLKKYKKKLRAKTQQLAKSAPSPERVPLTTKSYMPIKTSTLLNDTIVPDNIKLRLDNTVKSLPAPIAVKKLKNIINSSMDDLDFGRTLNRYGDDVTKRLRTLSGNMDSVLDRTKVDWQDVLTKLGLGGTLAIGGGSIVADLLEAAGQAKLDAAQAAASVGRPVINKAEEIIEAITPERSTEQSANVDDEGSSYWGTGIGAAGGGLVAALAANKLADKYAKKHKTLATIAGALLGAAGGGYAGSFLDK